MSTAPLVIAKKLLLKLYRDHVNSSLEEFSGHYSQDIDQPVWQWVDASLSPVSESNEDNALLLDTDIGLGLYFLKFSADVDIREQMSHALRLRSVLLPRNLEELGDSDKLGSWRLALHWYMDKTEFPRWLEEASSLRGETAHFEEISIDAIVCRNDNWESTFASYGFPRALLCVRDVLRKPTKGEVDKWGSADSLVKNLVSRFPANFEDKFQKQFAQEVSDKFDEINSSSSEGQPNFASERTPTCLSSLDIKYFRNIERLGFSFPGDTGVSVIQGPNGTGKSAIFEALSFAISGSSFRMEQFRADSNVKDKDGENYLERYIRPIGEVDVSPTVSVNGGDFEFNNELLLQNQFESLGLAGTMLSQDESASLLRMSRSDLGAQILGDASKLAGSLRNYVDQRYEDARRRQKEFLDEWSLNKNIRKLETARLKIADIFLNRNAQIPVSQVAWLRQKIRLADHLVIQEMEGLVTDWRKEEENNSDCARKLADMTRSNDDVNTLLKEIIEQRASTSERTNRLFSRIRSVTREWPPAVSSDARTWGAWLERQARRTAINDEGIDSLLVDQKRLLEQQQELAKAGQQAGSHVSHLESALVLIEDQNWVQKAGQSCPTCETDFSAQNGILNKISVVLKGASERVDMLRDSFRQITSKLEEIGRELRNLGAESSPIDAEKQGEVLKALQAVRHDEASDTLVLLQNSKSREELCDALMHLEQIPGDINQSLDTGDIADSLTLELLTAFSIAGSASDEENAWRAVRSELNSELAKVVDEHLPTTIQAVWAELALNLTPLSAQLPGAFSLGIDSRISEPTATFALKSEDGEPRLAQYVLNSAEIRTLGQAWFYLRYLISGRFDFSFLVLDDPAQEMDQPTYRELCRFWETFTRLHRRLGVPLQLVILLHLDERALDAARATNATIHFLRWNQGKSELLKSTRLFGESIVAPTPEVMLSVADSNSSK